jgi:hypothetical protein
MSDFTCTDGAVFHDAAHVLEFVFAGKALITLKSLRTQRHFTFKVNKGKKGDAYFVSVLHDHGEYVYLGMISNDRTQLFHTRKSFFPFSNERFAAFRFFLDQLVGKNTIPSTLEVRHNGRCGKCSRVLTHPESIDRGIGPECWNKLTA